MPKALAISWEVLAMKTRPLLDPIAMGRSGDQFQFNGEYFHPFLLVKKLGPLTLLCLVHPEKQVYTVLDLKDDYSSASHWQRWINPSLLLNGQTQREVTLGNLQLPQGFKNSLALFNETLDADLLPFHQKFFRKIDYKRATEGQLPELQTLGYRMLAKKAQLCTSKATCPSY